MQKFKVTFLVNGEQKDISITEDNEKKAKELGLEMMIAEFPSATVVFNTITKTGAFKWMGVVEEEGNFFVVNVDADDFHTAMELVADTYIEKNAHSDAGADIFSIVRLAKN